MSLNGAVSYMFCYDASIISPEIAQRFADGVWQELALERGKTMNPWKLWTRENDERVKTMNDFRMPHASN